MFIGDGTVVGWGADQTTCPRLKPGLARDATGCTIPHAEADHGFLAGLLTGGGLEARLRSGTTPAPAEHPDAVAKETPAPRRPRPRNPPKPSRRRRPPRSRRWASASAAPRPGSGEPAGWKSHQGRPRCHGRSCHRRPNVSRRDDLRGQWSAHDPNAHAAPDGGCPKHILDVRRRSGPCQTAGRGLDRARPRTRGWTVSMAGPARAGASSPFFSIQITGQRSDHDTAVELDPTRAPRAGRCRRLARSLRRQTLKWGRLPPPFASLAAHGRDPVPPCPSSGPDGQSAPLVEGPARGSDSTLRCAGSGKCSSRSGDGGVRQAASLAVVALACASGGGPAKAPDRRCFGIVLAHQDLGARAASSHP